ncbi:DsbA family oxidoreductase [Mesorhizobium sp. ZMM04-5]|uniref:DsbA family oxidoreductase n=1 Tax=Mesorhizobium marinum TaxID=3228790 RepID=A0ABV3R4I8_9HYPH
MTDQQAIRVDVVSDVVCPWCFLGQKRLDQAIAASGVDVAVHWRPFQLDATIPAGGMDRKAYMNAKFGSEERVREAHGRLEALGQAAGIDYAFDAITVSPNTLDAHRTIRWAGSAGPEVQNRLVRGLFSAYFERGLNIGDPAVLADAAAAAGMDRSVVESLLAGDADRDAVSEEAATASRMGITGVPCFLFEGKYAVMGAQEASTLTDAIRQIAAAKARGELDAAG